MPPHSEQIVSRICGALFRGSLTHCVKRTSLHATPGSARAFPCQLAAVTRSAGWLTPSSTGTAMFKAYGLTPSRQPTL
ncbi:hypothetical protein BRO03_14350 [Xanthomonas oryzae pv. oryzae]|nr:hypothetical protein BRO09_21895 [Xanthomonas oryzae pv. oryzae]RBB06333.1 hypothetical protein BRO12_20210 [Xanthomonas oryzae pv. oryzae]RBB11597.1 hypothetical protein BRN97_14860 [Xanthomonas oryzae pv. oryzae]RBB14191.1 hypothetical protein BRO13_24810 [Xanthomonas oryzae pv. oryzae]RBB22979.1 hypothetical protein BRO04_18620 [Xanthomonas oryzae pv. oryzae]